MAITEKKVYEVHCDKCKDFIEDDRLKPDKSESITDALQEMAWSGWGVKGGKLLCKRCLKEAMEDEVTITLTKSEINDIILALDAGSNPQFIELDDKLQEALDDENIHF